MIEGVLNLILGSLTQDDLELIGDAFWAALAARSLPPAHVEIIEALRWIDLSLTATDLLRVFEGQRVGLRIEYRLRQLARLDAIELDDNEKAGGPRWAGDPIA